jgi:hypothetical protein
MKKTLLLLFAFVLSIGTAWADKTVYLQPGVWNTDNPVFAVWAFGADDTELNPNKFITMSEIGESGYYKAEVPDAYKKILFFRGPSADWEAAWKNQTDDITSFENNTLFKITGWKDSPNGNSGYNADPMNFSLLGTATASFAALPAVNANDGNKGTRWGSEGGQDDTWLQIAWGEAQTFNTVKIYCEGAMNAANAPALAFDIQTSDNGEAWTTRKHVWGKNADGSYITVVLNENVTAKYVRFQGVKQGVYGYSFWEFEVYNTDYSGKTLNSIELSTYKNVTKTNAGRTIALSLIGKTAEDEEIPTGAITWNNTTPAVGTVTNETFNALTVGTTTVSATAGGKISEEITFTVTAPQVLGSVVLPYRIWSATQGVGGITVSVLDTEGNDFEGDVSLSWEGSAPVGAEFNGRKLTFGAASGAGTFTLKATDGVTTVTTPVYMVGTNPTPPTADSGDVLALYSGTYSTENYDGWGTTWEWGYGSRDVAVINGDNCVRIHNVGTYGFSYPDTDLSQYSKLRFDIYTTESVTGHVKIEKTNIDNKSFTTTAGAWKTVEIDLDGLTMGAGNRWVDIYVGENNTDKARDVLIDNVYFLKESVALTEGYYVVGTMNDWNLSNSYKMTLNDAAAPTIEYMLGPVALTNGTQLKAVYSADGTAKTTWYPAGEGNNYTISKAGNYIIYCRPNADGGGDWHEGVLYVASVSNLVDEGATGKAGAHKLTGTWDANDFATIDAAAKASSYDLTGLTIGSTLDVVGKTANPYCMFITSAAGKVNRNEVVWDEANSRYNGFALIFEETTNDGKSYDINTDIKPIQVTNPKVNRTMGAGLVYTTVTLPFNYGSIPNPEKTQTKVYAISSSSKTGGETTVTFTEVNSLEAGKPYLVNSFAAALLFNEDIGTVNIDWSTTDQAEGVVTAVGTFKNKTLTTADNAYVLPGNITSTGALTFNKANGANIRPFRAYITVPGGGAKINVLFDDTTGIHAATAEQLEAIFNIYSIDGKLVRQNSDSKVGLEKGIYIINGKKVIVK